MFPTLNTSKPGDEKQVNIVTSPARHKGQKATQTKEKLMKVPA